MADDSSRTKWVVGSLIALLGAGAGMVAVVQYVTKPRVEISRYEVGIDRYGGQEHSDFYAEDVKDCGNACLNEPECRAFSFNVNAHQCWLKSNVPLRVENSGFTSGVKMRKSWWKIW